MFSFLVKYTLKYSKDGRLSVKGEQKLKHWHYLALFSILQKYIIPCWPNLISCGDIAIVQSFLFLVICNLFSCILLYVSSNSFCINASVPLPIHHAFFCFPNNRTSDGSGLSPRKESFVNMTTPSSNSNKWRVRQNLKG